MANLPLLPFAIVSSSWVLSCTNFLLKFRVWSWNLDEKNALEEYINFTNYEEMKRVKKLTLFGLSLSSSSSSSSSSSPSTSSFSHFSFLTYVKWLKEASRRWKKDELMSWVIKLRKITILPFEWPTYPYILLFLPFGSIIF